VRAQPHDDFAFFDYAPMAFLVLRALVGISPMAYMLSLTKEAVRAFAARTRTLQRKRARGAFA
jgi:hypothetical protein